MREESQDPKVENFHEGHRATCLCCENLSLYESTPDYSEVTPGDPAQMSCGKGNFWFSDSSWGDALKTIHNAAFHCVDFEPK